MCREGRPGPRLPSMHCNQSSSNCLPSRPDAQGSRPVNPPCPLTECSRRAPWYRCRDSSTISTPWADGYFLYSFGVLLCWDDGALDRGSSEEGPGWVSRIRSDPVRTTAVRTLTDLGALRRDLPRPDLDGTEGGR